MKQLLKYVLPLLFVGLVACEKDSPADDKGEPKEPFYWSKMSCTINGELWGDCFPGVFGPVPRVFGQRFTGSYIDFTGMEWCEKYDERNSYLYIKIADVSDTGTYYLNEDNKAIFYLTQGIEKEEYITQNIGTVRITRFEDRVNHTLIDGTFAFTAYNADLKQSLHITEGKFENIRLDHF